MKPTGPIFAIILVLAGMSACIPWDLGEKDFPFILTDFPIPTSTTSATLVGSISGLKKGIVQDHGFVWAFDPVEPTVESYEGIISLGESGNKSFQADITDLQRNEQYLVRAFAILDGKAFYGWPLLLQTGDLAVSTDGVFYLSGRSMEITGTLVGLDAGVGANQYGHCWSFSNPLPSIATDLFSSLGRPNTDGYFSSTIDDLPNNQTFYFRSYVLINFGIDTLYGEVLTHTTSLIDVWDAVSDLPQPVGRGLSFVLEGNAYAGLGDSPFLWKFQPGTGSWTQMASYPDGSCETGAAFVIGDTAYVGLGKEVDPPKFFKYTSQNQWSEMEAVFPGNTRFRGVSFSVGTKGYVGLGFHDYGAGFFALSEIYVYNQLTGKWSNTPIQYPGGAKISPSVFTIDETAYIVGGSISRDVWAFTPSQPTPWIQKEDFTGGNSEIGTGFSINGKGYVGMGFLGGFGSSNNLWRYNPNQDTWGEVAALPGPSRRYPMSFSLGGKGYVLGGEGLSANLSDVWVYTPE